MRADDSFIDRIYEAAVVPELWRSVLQEFTRTAGAKDSVLVVARGTNFSQWVVSSPDFEEFMLDYSRLFPDNIRTRRLLAAQHAGFVRDCDVLTRAEMETEPVFRDYGLSRGLHSGVATAIHAPSGDNIIVHAEYSVAQGPATAEIVARLDPFRPHFARAALLSSRLDLERVQVAATALQMIGLPAAVLHGGGRLYAANTLLHELVDDLIFDRRDRLHLIDADADALLANALAVVTGRMPAAVNSIPLASANGRPPYVLHILPIRGAAHDVFSRATALLVVTPVDRAAVPTAEVLQGLFDLTPAEARVARGIGAAQSVDDLALSLNVSRETVRTHLKAVLGKTGLNRQIELVALLAGKALPEKAD